jgi:hypothetical protein
MLADAKFIGRVLTEHGHEGLVCIQEKWHL